MEISLGTILARRCLEERIGFGLSGDRRRVDQRFGLIPSTKNSAKANQRTMADLGGVIILAEDFGPSIF
jgi:hypothetical protein